MHATAGHAQTLLVSSAGDGQSEGTLRTVLHYACDTQSDDVVTFAKTDLDQIRVYLHEPLVIPENCKGTVTLVGSNMAETIMDASKFADGEPALGEGCTLDIYSNNNSVRGFGFSNNENGAAVCIYGRNNIISDNKMGVEDDGSAAKNHYGVVVWRIFSEENTGMDGSYNTITKNIIGPQTSHGVWIDADDTSLSENDIVASGGHGIELKGSSIVIKNNKILGNGGCPTHGEYIEGQPACEDEGALQGSGIYVRSGSKEVLIGGDSFSSDKNVIQYNKNGGVVLQKSKSTETIKITHNQISKNYGTNVGIDLSGNGITLNDILDNDMGANKLLNYPEHMQAFELVGSRYLNWGVAFYDENIELYAVAPEDVTRGVTHGGGDDFIRDIAISDGNSFESLHEGSTGIRALTSVGFDSNDNTSEFSLNAALGDDEDYDGIPDEYETGDGTPESDGSSKEDADSDGDGLPDPIEDKNRNGKWEAELDELCAYNPDTDGDNLSDFAETHGDGVYNKGVDTDPLDPDSDDDGIPDGTEDKNNNGIWDGYLKETSPLLTDSDQDGFPDNSDTCPSIVNPGQEPWYCE